MAKPFKRISHSGSSTHEGTHAYQHWLISNQAYFITARVRDKSIFWDRFEHYTQEFSFDPWICSLLDNHYHFEGILRVGENLPKLMQRLHGSVAKLVNDTLDVRITSFWRNAKGKEYFDGCLRDEKQGRRTYAYVRDQAVRHGIVKDYRDYPHTRIYVGLEDAIARANALRAFLQGVPYKRYGERH